MTKEMPKGGKQSLEMMYRTCGIQINYDYTSEENFEKIFRLGNYLTPLTIALYSNSPFEKLVISHIEMFITFRYNIGIK